MTDPVGARRVVDPVSKDGYELEFEDTFRRQPRLRDGCPHYLPQWSSREASAARYEVGGGGLRLHIEADQPPWCPEVDGQTRVSSLQTGLFAGPVGSTVGQHRFTHGLVVREAQENARLYTPHYGLFELRAKAIDDPAQHGGAVDDRVRGRARAFGGDLHLRDLRPRRGGRAGRRRDGPASVRRPEDPRRVRRRGPVAIDAREFHDYAAEWTPGHVAFYVDERLVKVVEQSPGYPCSSCSTSTSSPRTSRRASVSEAVRGRLLRGYRSTRANSG